MPRLDAFVHLNELRSHLVNSMIFLDVSAGCLAQSPPERRIFDQAGDGARVSGVARRLGQQSGPAIFDEVRQVRQARRHYGPAGRHSFQDRISPPAALMADEHDVRVIEDRRGIRP